MDAQLISSRDGGGALLEDVTSALGVEGSDFLRLNLKVAGRVAGVALKTATRSFRTDENRRPVLEALEDLLIVSRAGGPKGERPVKRGSTLLVGSMVVLALSLIYAWAVHSNWPASFVLAIFGLVVDGAVALFSRPSIEEACSGDSGSGPRSRSIVGALSTAAGSLVFGAMLHLNGALDSAPPELRHGVVISAARFGGRNSEPTIVRWRDGSESNVRGWLESTHFKENDQVVEYVHPGALGFTWRTTSRAPR